MDDLTQRIHALPPELFERIYHFTFTANPAVHKVTWDYKPPKLLAIDRASRQLFASSYYGQGSSFIFPSHSTRGSPLYIWLPTLTSEHRRLLHDVRMLYRSPDRLPPSQWRAYLVTLRDARGRHIQDEYSDFQNGTFHLGIEVDDDDKMVLWSDGLATAIESDED